MQTVDYFTPIVDDPYTFGQIAAANAVSDIYAMGARPIMGLNIVGFPVDKLSLDVLVQILRGGNDKAKEAGIPITGGHTIDDNEPKYGMVITGLVHPDKIVANSTAKIGDLLILTKPIGTGIIATAMKEGLAPAEAMDIAIKSMSMLNKSAAECMLEVGVNACTDITGFGLLGHAHEMIGSDDIGMIINAKSVPLLPYVREYAEMGLIPGGTIRNKEFSQPWVDNNPDTPPYLLDILYDPQTSGGLLLSVPKQKMDNLLQELEKTQVKEAAVIGEVVADPRGKIIISY